MFAIEQYRDYGFAARQLSYHVHKRIEQCI